MVRDHLRESSPVKMLTVREYAEKHGVTVPTVYNWLYSGELEGALENQRPIRIPANFPRPPSRSAKLKARRQGPYLKPGDRARHKETGKVAIIVSKSFTHHYYHFEGEPEFPQRVGGAADFSEKL